MLQFLFGVFFLRTDFGVSVLSYMHVRIDEFTSYADTGSEFVFGKQYKDFPFIFKVFTIVFSNYDKLSKKHPSFPMICMVGIVWSLTLNHKIHEWIVRGEQDKSSDVEKQPSYGGSKTSCLLFKEEGAVQNQKGNNRIAISFIAVHPTVVLENHSLSVRLNILTKARTDCCGCCG